METKTNFKAGDTVRLRQAEHDRVGTLQSFNAFGQAVIHFEPRPGTVTVGIYPPRDIELARQRSEAGGAAGTQRKRASTADVIAPLPPEAPKAD